MYVDNEFVELTNEFIINLHFREVQITELYMKSPEISTNGTQKFWARTQLNYGSNQGSAQQK